MKTMTCKQLGGACDIKFHANTFEEIAEISKNHGTEMYESGDEKHIKMIKKMMKLMNDPDAVNDWMNSKQKEFDASPDDK